MQGRLPYVRKYKNFRYSEFGDGSYIKNDTHVVVVIALYNGGSDISRCLFFSRGRLRLGTLTGQSP